MNWEDIDNYRRRLHVPWGWIYREVEDVAHNMIVDGRGVERGWDYRIAVCFVFDPFHWWRIEAQ
jgi:hypothetical protein